MMEIFDVGDDGDDNHDVDNDVDDCGIGGCVAVNVWLMIIQTLMSTNTYINTGGSHRQDSTFTTYITCYK